MKEQYKCQLASKQASYIDSMFTVFSQMYLVNAIEKLSKHSEKRLNVTEVGCYNARLMNFLIQRKVEVNYIGIDANEEYLYKSELKDHERVTLMIADIAIEIPVDFKSQDIVVCSEVFEHINAENLPNVIVNLVDLLKSGGTLITSFPINTRFDTFHNVSNEQDLGHVNFPNHTFYISMVEYYDMTLINFDSGFTIRSNYKVPNSILFSYQYKTIKRMLGDRIALAYAMTIDKEHTGGGYYTFIKEII